jgi:hypothetical protein
VAAVATFAASGLLFTGSANAVAGGTPVTDTSYQFVAKITMDGHACTGALVAPRWVISAATCFPENAQGGVPAKPTTVTLGRANLNGTGGHQVHVTTLVTSGDRDLVLAKLDTPIIDIAPLPVATTAATAGDTLQVAGYGRTATDWVPDQLSTAPFTAGATTGTTLAITSPTGNDTCRGDAGGPAIRLTNGKAELTGVTSTSWQHGCLAVTETRQGGTETRTDNVADWIHQHIDVIPAGPITGPGGKCADIYQSNITSTTKVDLYDCNGTGAQQWTLQPDGSIRSVPTCVDVANSSTTNGTKVQLYFCNGSAAQQWADGPNGSLRSLAKCMDVTQGNTANGTLIQLYDCNADGAQRWSTGPANSLRVLGKCLDIPQGNITDTTQLQLYDCNGTAPQSWTRTPSGQLNTAPRCMSPAAGGTTQSTPVQITDCDGSASQRWIPQDNSSLSNAASGLCLDLPQGDTTNGVGLQIYACNNTSSQTWQLPS